MYNVVNNITTMSHALPTEAGFWSLVVTMSAVMLLVGAVSALVSWLSSMGSNWEIMTGIDSDLNMVYPDSSELARELEGEALFFGELLPEATDDELPASKERMVTKVMTLVETALVEGASSDEIVIKNGLVFIVGKPPVRTPAEPVFVGWLPGTVQENTYLPRWDM